MSDARCEQHTAPRAYVPHTQFFSWLFAWRTCFLTLLRCSTLQGGITVRPTGWTISQTSWSEETMLKRCEDRKQEDGNQWLFLDTAPKEFRAVSNMNEASVIDRALFHLDLDHQGVTAQMEQVHLKVSKGTSPSGKKKQPSCYKTNQDCKFWRKMCFFTQKTAKRQTKRPNEIRKQAKQQLLMYAERHRITARTSAGPSNVRRHIPEKSGQRSPRTHLGPWHARYARKAAWQWATKLYRISRNQLKERSYILLTKNGMRSSIHLDRQSRWKIIYCGFWFLYAHNEQDGTNTRRKGNHQRVSTSTHGEWVDRRYWRGHRTRERFGHVRHCPSLRRHSSSVKSVKTLRKMGIHLSVKKVQQLRAYRCPWFIKWD